MSVRLFSRYLPRFLNGSIPSLRQNGEDSPCECLSLSAKDLFFLIKKERVLGR